RSTAVLANTARAVTAAHSESEQCSRMCPASTSVALMAFSQAITATGGASAGRANTPAAMAGARKASTVGPAVDRPVVLHRLGRRLETDRVHAIAGGGLKCVDQRRGHVGEHHPVPGP